MKVKYIADPDLYPLLGPATAGSAGIDLRASESAIVFAGHTVMIGSGLRVHIENPDYVGLVFIRSSLGAKGLMLGNCVGVIDSDYQGEIILPLTHQHDRIRIDRGDRIAQLLIVPVVVPEYAAVDEFDQTQRGSGGFGSTGRD